MSYRLKERPEDFIVEELSVEKNFQKRGNYSYCLLEKKNYSLQRVLDLLARLFHVKLKDIGYCGIKDKHAITKQVISLKHISKERIEEFHPKDITLHFLGYSDEPLYLGGHQGNRFAITVRNIDDIPTPCSFFVNYYGEQRFSQYNTSIGKALILKKYKEATDLIFSSSSDYSEKVKLHLAQHAQDYIGALRLIPKKIFQLYGHSYQSFLWNKTAKQYIQNTKNVENKKIPLIGFGMEIDDKEIRRIIEIILEQEGVSERDFVNRQMQELSLEGGFRMLLMDVLGFSMSTLEEDELHHGKKKITLSFSLGKGSYATEVVRQMFGRD